MPQYRQKTICPSLTLEEMLLNTRAVSTWSLHRTLGRFVAADAVAPAGRLVPHVADPGALSLLDLPAELKKRGYGAVQLRHCDLPSRTPEYLADLRAAIEFAGIELDTLLIEDGDLTHPELADVTEQWIGAWLDVAVALGARLARICAGRSAPTDALIVNSAERLSRLAQTHPEVRVVTENWLEMTPDADTVRNIMEETGSVVGLMIDLGNWSGPGKYEELAAIVEFADTCHAKAHIVNGDLDREDFRKSLQVLKDAGYTGPLALIYDGPDPDEWAWLDKEWGIVQEVMG
jgi:sugar phosphate isomerase/epimerase